MEEIDRLTGDFALQRAIEETNEISKVLPQIQDKLKILEAAMTYISVGETEQGDVPEESYGYIPLDLGHYFECLFDLETALVNDKDYRDPDLRHRRVSFVEAGCGSGRNVFLLKVTDRFEFGTVQGFDLSKPLIDHGRRVFGLGKDICTRDCMKFDYAPFDVIYFYRPFSDHDKEMAFEDQLVKSMKKGAYIIGCGNLSLSDDRRLLEKCDNGRIYKKLN